MGSSFLKHLIAIFPAFLLSSVCLGQSKIIKEPAFASPNAASLGKYGDIPVSYHTGVPQISVPLYTIQEGNLSLPISLSYHASGIRVDEVASSVGLGWSLNAGGMITRTVKGGPDEGILYGSLSGANSGQGPWGWYKNYGIHPAITSCSATPIQTQPQPYAPWNGSCAILYWEAGRGYVDCEPDLFTFNFGGYSGKFFFDATRKVHMIPESDFYIEPINNTPNLFYAWKIITPDGTKYFFGGTAKETAYSDWSELSSNKHVSSAETWYLYRIESANGENWINLQYTDDTYAFSNREGHSVVFREITAVNPQGGTFSPGELVSGNIINASTNLSTTLVDGRRLTSITTSSGYTTVDFTQSAAARQDLSRFSLNAGAASFDPLGVNTTSKSLQFIQVTTPSLCKKFEMSYDYYSSASCSGCVTGNTIDEKRLRLNWIQESDCASLTQPKYEFYYDTQPLARRYSLARDMWGYYNGADSNVGLLETFSNPVPAVNMTYTTPNTRAVHETKAQAGILNKIKYPTGGTSEFTYESHRENDAAPVLGGLRIKKIETKDDFGTTTTKNIKYLVGKLYINPANFTNHYPNSNDNWTNAFLGGTDFGIAHAANPVPPMFSSQGYHIGYTKVKVEEPGNGYTIYRYLNSSPIYVSTPRYPFPPGVADIGTSTPTGESYHIEGITDENVYVSASTMINTTTTAVTNVGAKTVQAINSLNNFGEYGIWMDYNLSTYRFNLTSKSETKDGVTTTTTYAYGATHNSPTSIEFTDSQGLVRRTEYKYPGDAGSGAPVSMYTPTDVNFKNMLTTPVEEKTLVSAALKAKTTTQFTQTGSSLLLTSQRKYPTGTAEFVEDQYQYDPSLNIAAIIRSNGVNKSFLWGYKNQFPIASVENASYVSTPKGVTAPFGTSVTGNVASCTNLGPLVIEVAQTVTFNTSITLGSAPGASITLTMKNSSGAPVFGPRVYNAAGSFPESIALPAGTYTFCYQASSFPSPYTGFSSINFIVNYTSGIRSNLFHSSFEENGVTLAAARSGSKVWNGVYNVTMPHVNGNYELVYWKRPTDLSTDWALTVVPITISSPTTADNPIGQVNYYIDDVRLYPVGALMTTYTYSPGLGITSSSDPNHYKSFYEYDTLGRLKTIKGDKQNIVKTFQYHYKGQP